MGMAVSPYQMTRPYSIVPIAGQVSYTNAFDYNMMPATQSGLWPAYSMPYYRFKREAEPDLPFEVRSKMTTSPLSRQEYKVQVDRMGNGQSYQHVERQTPSRRYSDLRRDQMEDISQMIQTHRMMIKREAESDPAFSYTVMSEHPSETLLRPFYQQLPAAMARQEYMSPRQRQQMTMKQIHPDGAFSYVRLPAVNFPSTTSLYNMLNRIRPVAMAWA